MGRISARDPLITADDTTTEREPLLATSRRIAASCGSDRDDWNLCRSVLALVMVRSNAVELTLDRDEQRRLYGMSR